MRKISLKFTASKCKEVSDTDDKYTYPSAEQFLRFDRIMLDKYEVSALVKSDERS